MDHLPKAIRILLIRHGETEWNRLHRFQGRSDVPLNQRGREQARALAAALKEEPLVAIYSSPLSRALETARIVKRFHPLIHLFVEEGLIEMDLGEFDGMEAQEWATRYPEFLATWREDPSSVHMPGGESLGDVQSRVLDTLERIAGSHVPGSNLLISGHNFVNLTLLCHAMQIPLARFRRVGQGTASLNVLLKQGDRLWTEVVDDRSHLRELLASEEGRAGGISNSAPIKTG
jgi:broad specificity phosphatase PhoE